MSLDARTTKESMKSVAGCDRPAQAGHCSKGQERQSARSLSRGRKWSKPLKGGAEKAEVRYRRDGVLSTPCPSKDGDGSPAMIRGTVHQKNSMGFVSPLGSLPKDLRGWFNESAVRVSACDKAAGEVLKAKGVKVEYSDRLSNPHAVSAGFREAAVKSVLAYAGKKQLYMQVLDVFGSARSIGYGPKFDYTSIEDRPLGSFLNVDWYAAPDTPIAGDGARGADVRGPFILGKTYDVVIVVDVYQCGDNPNQVFSADFVKELIEKSKTGHVYVVNRTFPGEAGCDKAYLGADGQKVIEQVFYRDDSGLIHSSPDHTHSGYASHPSPDWLFERSYQGVDIAPVSTFGPYRVVRLALTKVGAQSLGCLIRPKGDIERLELDTKKRTWHGLWKKSCKDTVLVHRPTHVQLGPKFVAKGPNGQAFDMAMSSVASCFRSDELMTVLLERHPEYYKKVLTGTTLAILYHDRKIETDLMLSCRVEVAGAERDLILARGLAPIPEEDSLFSRFKSGVISIMVLAFILLLQGYPLTGLPKTDRFLTLCLVAPVTEEIAKFYFPITGWLVVAIEALVYVTSGHNLTFWLPSVCFHVFSMWLHSMRNARSLLLILVHMVWNFIIIQGWGIIPELGFASVFESLLSSILIEGNVNWKLVGVVLAISLLGLIWRIVRRQRGKEDVFEMFKLRYAEGQQRDVYEGLWVGIPPSANLPSYVSKVRSVPKHFRGEIRVFVDRVETDVVEAMHLLSEEVGKNLTYPILITQCMMHQPANVALNLLVATLHRLHNDPFVGNPFPAAVRHLRWKELGEDFVEMFVIDGKTAVITQQDNISLMGKKGRRLEDALNADMRGETIHLGKTVNLKWNETISANKEVDGVYTMKPRAIQNLPAVTHGKMGGFAREFAQELHEKFDGRVWNVYGIPVKIYFASGFDQRKLSEIGEAISQGHVVFAMSGDDSVVGWGGLVSEFGGEADQSKFDHTQDDGPMRFFMSQILFAFGFPPEFVEMAYACCSSGYTLRRGRLFARGLAGVQMPTGITTTTTFNSLSTLCMFLWFLKHRHVGGLAEAGRELGFDVKYFPADGVHTMTFLKGWFQLGRLGIQWMPLPSCVLKLGKILNDPQVITATKRGTRKIKLSPKEAVKRVAWALSQSYGTVRPDYPILGTFVSVLSRLGKTHGVLLNGLQESWKPRLDGIEVNREVVLESILCRYGCLKQDVEDLERLLDSITTLPAYVEHPVFQKLKDVDY